MKDQLSISTLARLVRYGAIALLAAMIPAGMAQAAIQCYECHGTAASSDYRPRDAASRNDSTGAFVGNHQTHMAAPASPAACMKCHNTTGYTSAHRDGFINLTTNINSSSPTKGKYMITGSQVTSKAQSATPVLGTCTNVNCHFEATTPVWGSATFASPADCDKCHGAPPTGGPTGAAGSHIKHNQYYAGAANCQKCHSNNTTFQHATSAGKRNLNISFAAAPNSGAGAYSGAINDYMPSQTNTFGNCTATYCHSPGTKAVAPFTAPNSTATWGGTMPANCTGCHKSDYASGDDITSGSHLRHIRGYAPFNYNIMKCDKCHAVTGSATMSIVDTSKHVDGQVTIAFKNSTSAANGSYNGTVAKPSAPLSKTPGSAVGSCANIYCHSSGQGANGTWPPVYTTPTWGTAATGMCGTCHGDFVSHGGFSQGNPLTTGSHAKHLQNGIITTSSTYERCIACHAYDRIAFNPASCNTVCHSPGNSKHINFEINVDIPTNYGGTATYNGTAKPGDGYSTCSNVSCHNNTTTPAWGTATPISCDGCHPLNALGGSHIKHVDVTSSLTLYNYTANRSTAATYNFGCSNCHPLSSTNHWNNAVNVTLKNNEAGVGTLRSKNSATAAGIGVANSGITGTTKTSVICSAAYCHSNGNAAALVYAATPDWYGGTFANSDRCANCHGNSPNTTIAGSKSHYNNRMLGYTSNPGGHVVGIHALSIYSSPRGMAKAGTTGMSSHGNPATSTAIGCNICHYETVNTARNDDNVHCRDCHFTGNTVGAQTGNKASIADKSKHVNGLVNVSFKPVNVISKAQSRQKYFVTHTYSSVWIRSGGYKLSGSHDIAKEQLDTATMWNSTTKTCSNIACHMGNSVKWSDNDGTTECISCHGSL